MPHKFWMHVYKPPQAWSRVEGDCYDNYTDAVECLNIAESAGYVETITRDKDGNLISIDMREDKEEAEREAEAEAADQNRLRSSYYTHANLGIR